MKDTGDAATRAKQLFMLLIPVPVLPGIAVGVRLQSLGFKTPSARKAPTS